MDRKSTSGHLQFLGNKIVSWASKKQQCVSTSTAKSEYVAAASCCSQVLWMQTQLRDYGLEYKKIPIYCDSKSAVAISTNLVQHSITKHIDIRYHFLKDNVEKENIELYFVNTEFQLAYLFTKALDEKRFKFLISRLAMENYIFPDTDTLEVPHVLSIRSSQHQPNLDADRQLIQRGMFLEIASNNVRYNPYAKTTAPVITTILQHHPLNTAHKVGQMDHFTISFGLNKFRRVLGFPEENIRPGANHFEPFAIVEEAMAAIRSIGHVGALNATSQFNKSKLPPTYNCLFTILSRCLTGKKIAQGTATQSFLIFFHGVLFNRHYDYAAQIFHDLKELLSKKQTHLPFPRFFSILIACAMERNQDIPRRSDAEPVKIYDMQLIRNTKQQVLEEIPLFDELLAYADQNAKSVRVYRSKFPPMVQPESAGPTQGVSPRREGLVLRDQRSWDLSQGVQRENTERGTGGAHSDQPTHSSNVNVAAKIGQISSETRMDDVFDAIEVAQGVVSPIIESSLAVEMAQRLQRLMGHDSSSEKISATNSQPVQDALHVVFGTSSSNTQQIIDSVEASDAVDGPTEELPGSDVNDDPMDDDQGSSLIVQHGDIRMAEGVLVENTDVSVCEWEVEKDGESETGARKIVQTPPHTESSRAATSSRVSICCRLPLNKSWYTQPCIEQPHQSTLLFLNKRTHVGTTFVGGFSFPAATTVVSSSFVGGLRGSEGNPISVNIMPTLTMGPLSSTLGSTTSLSDLGVSLPSSSFMTFIRQQSTILGSSSTPIGSLSSASTIASTLSTVSSSTVFLHRHPFLCLLQLIVDTMKQQLARISSLEQQVATLAKGKAPMTDPPSQPSQPTADSLSIPELKNLLFSKLLEAGNTEYWDLAFKTSLDASLTKTFTEINKTFMDGLSQLSDRIWGLRRLVRFEERPPREKQPYRQCDAIVLAGGESSRGVGRSDMQSTFDFLSSVQEDVPNWRAGSEVKDVQRDIGTSGASRSKSELDKVLELLENVANEIHNYEVPDNELESGRVQADRNMEDMCEDLMFDFEQSMPEDDVEGPRESLWECELEEELKTEYIHMRKVKGKRVEDLDVDKKFVSVEKYRTNCLRCYEYSEITLRREDRKEYVISEADFPNVEFNVFLSIMSDLKSKLIISFEEMTALGAVLRHLRASITLAHLYDFQLGLENWTSKMYSHRPANVLHEDFRHLALYTVFHGDDKMIVCVYPDFDGEPKGMLVHEVMLFSDGTLRMVVDQLRKRLQFDHAGIHLIDPPERHLIKHFVKEIEKRLDVRNDIRIVEVSSSLALTSREELKLKFHVLSEERTKQFSKIEELEETNLKRGQSEHTLNLFTKQTTQHPCYQAKPGLGHVEKCVLEKAPANLYNFDNMNASKPKPRLVGGHVTKNFVM
ncbi:hypothetical protein OSB04_029169 [Centaurea solstitialis]|uniref:Uncharacterized protein n=1 Tax=Centaurea solstitialis TaxID=347529 RepID=A0AA38T1W8_9ASTR|nr:hypothetical protein OSB04_029169 [Centaurea solstitialis]